MMIRLNGWMVASVAGIGWILVTSAVFGQDKADPKAAKLSKLLEKHPDADANKDGKLTVEEAQAYRQANRGPGKGGLGLGMRGPGPGPWGKGDRAQMFKMHPEWDINGDGTLSDEEIEAGRSAMWGMSREEVAAKIIEKHPEADTDGDGKLSPEEFAAFHGGRPGGPPVAPWAGLDRLIEQFAEADLDGNGQLSKDELIKFRQKFGRAPWAGAGLGPRFGRPGDRPIPEQARAKMLENHPEADTDKDGKLSDAEMKAFWEQNRGKLGLGKGDKASKGLGEGKGRQGKGARGGQGATGQQ
ncbi:MAG: EF-hand domain-containing protein [Phycisphaerae bacterium]